ncbi:[protein ADP-ribosylglutamate] hydrolase [Hydrogenibacillus schlegelii]|nr:[protein ADP-ribosylglutamate] hydrolase [Hydrogenibacillus schlegelii]
MKSDEMKNGRMKYGEAKSGPADRGAPESALLGADLQFAVVAGDLTRFPADAIVNAANAEMIHGGGVAYAIARAAAGDAAAYTRLTQEAMQKEYGRPFIRHDEVVVTPPLALAERGIRLVLHIVGPRCDGRWDKETEAKLTSALFAALRRADAEGIRHIAFPAVSAGIYGCPFDAVVRTFAAAVQGYAASFPRRTLRQVTLVLRTEDDVRRARQALGWDEQDL